MRTRGILVALGASLLAACATPAVSIRAARAQQNAAVVLAFIDMAYNRHEVREAFRLYVGPGFHQHEPGAADGVDAAIASLTRLTHETYPGLRLDVKRTVAQGDLVAVHAHEIRAAAGSGTGGGRATVDFFRLEHGRIVEQWQVAQDVPAGSGQDSAIF
jgi:predicted SnoaL-like aldol condensation-catalyzing enzyme